MPNRTVNHPIGYTLTSSDLTKLLNLIDSGIEPPLGQGDLGHGYKVAQDTFSYRVHRWVKEIKDRKEGGA